MKTTEFINAVKNAAIELKGNQMFSMEYISKVTTTKTQRTILGGEAYKIVNGQFQFGYSYQNAVNNRATAETGTTTDFHSQKLPFGVWDILNKIIKHNENLYLRFYRVQNGKYNVQYFVNGLKATPEQTAILTEIETDKPTTTQTNLGLTQNQVKPRVVKIQNIAHININHTELINTGETETEKIAI